MERSEGLFLSELLKPKRAIILTSRMLSSALSSIGSIRLMMSWGRFVSDIGIPIDTNGMIDKK